MIVRKLYEEEITAIITLLQCAENIGTGYWSDEQARECILKAYTDMPTMRAKDVDIAWTLAVINGARKHRHSMDEVDVFLADA